MIALSWLILIFAAIFLGLWLWEQPPVFTAATWRKLSGWFLIAGVLIQFAGRAQPYLIKVQEEKTRQQTEFWTRYSAVSSSPDPETCAPQNRINLTWSPSAPAYYPLHKCLDLERPAISGEQLVVVISRQPHDTGIMPSQKLAGARETGIVGPWGGWNIEEINKDLFDFTGWQNYYYGVMIFLGGELTPREEKCKISNYAETEPTWAGSEKQRWPIRWPRGENLVRLRVPARAKLWLSVNGVNCEGYLTVNGQQYLINPYEILGAFMFLVYVENR